MAHRDTLAVHAGEPPLDRRDAPMVPDITIGSASGYPDLASLEAAMAGSRGYGRYGTDNHRQLEEALAVIEGQGLGGRLETVVVSSGMAAIALAFLTELNAGDHILAAHDCYGTTLTFLRDDLARFGVTSSFIDVQDLGAVRAALQPTTRILFCEVCTNPLIRVPDLEALAGIAHHARALLVVDSTVPTPILCQPFRWGADVVVHSATKNLSGHADVIGGAVIGKPAWIEAARTQARTWGPVLGPFETWLTLRGLRTLAVRMERHTKNALALAEFLGAHPAVAGVNYPGLPDSPYRALAGRLLPDGAGALLSLELRAGLAGVGELVRRLRLVRLMPSLGHVATTVSHPVSTSHRGLSPAERERAGIPDGLVRCSVGLERIDDLIADFDKALAA